MAMVEPALAHRAPNKGRCVWSGARSRARLCGWKVPTRSRPTLTWRSFDNRYAGIALWDVRMDIGDGQGFGFGIPAFVLGDGRDPSRYAGGKSPEISQVTSRYSIPLSRDGPDPRDLREETKSRG